MRFRVYGPMNDEERKGFLDSFIFATGVFRFYTGTLIGCFYFDFRLTGVGALLLLVWCATLLGLEREREASRADL